MKLINKQSIKFIQQYVDKKHLAILSILSIISSLLLVAVAFVTKLVIGAIETGNSYDIAIYISVAVAILLLYAIIFGVNNFLTTRFTLISTKKIVNDSHNKILKSKYQDVTASHSVEQLKIVANDSEIAVTNYIKLFPTICSIVIKLVFGIALMIYISYEITLIALAVGVIMCVGMLVVKKPLKSLHKKAQQKVAISNAYMQEGLKNIEVVKSLDISSSIKQGVEDRLTEVQKALEKQSKYINLINSVVYFLLEITFLFCLVYGGVLILQNKMLVSDFVVLISVIEIIKAPFMSATNISNSIFTMTASAERVIQVVSLTKDNYLDISFDKIVFDNVSYKYNDKYVLKDFSCEINKNEKIAVCGDSGNGKTTFVRLLLGIIEPLEGSIYLVKNGEKFLLNGKLLKAGYVPQNLQLFNDSIINNLTNTSSNEEVENALKLADLQDVVNSKPEKLNYNLKENGTGLSQGQMQRLAIARAILSGSSLLVLDEPFSSLDTTLGKDIFAKLTSLNKTVIIVSHNDFVSDNIQKVLTI